MDITGDFDFEYTPVLDTQPKKKKQSSSTGTPADSNSKGPSTSEGSSTKPRKRPRNDTDDVSPSKHAGGIDDGEKPQQQHFPAPLPPPPQASSTMESEGVRECSSAASDPFSPSTSMILGVSSRPVVGVGVGVGSSTAPAVGGSGSKKKSKPSLVTDTFQSTAAILTAQGSRGVSTTGPTPASQATAVASIPSTTGRRNKPHSSCTPFAPSLSTAPQLYPQLPLPSRGPSCGSGIGGITGPGDRGGSVASCQTGISSATMSANGSRSGGGKGSNVGFLSVSRTKEVYTVLPVGRDLGRTKTKLLSGVLRDRGGAVVISAEAFLHLVIGHTGLQGATEGDVERLEVELDDVAAALCNTAQQQQRQRVPVAVRWVFVSGCDRSSDVPTKIADVYADQLHITDTVLSEAVANFFSSFGKLSTTGASTTTPPVWLQRMEREVHVSPAWVTRCAEHKRYLPTDEYKLLQAPPPPVSAAGNPTPAPQETTPYPPSTTEASAGQKWSSPFADAVHLLDSTRRGSLPQNTTNTNNSKSPGPPPSTSPVKGRADGFLPVFFGDANAPQYQQRQEISGGGEARANLSTGVGSSRKGGWVDEEGTDDRGGGGGGGVDTSSGLSWAEPELNEERDEQRGGMVSSVAVSPFLSEGQRRFVNYLDRVKPFACQKQGRPQDEPLELKSARLGRSVRMLDNFLLGGGDDEDDMEDAHEGLDLQHPQKQMKGEKYSEEAGEEAGMMQKKEEQSRSGGGTSEAMREYIKGEPADDGDQPPLGTVPVIAGACAPGGSLALPLVGISRSDTTTGTSTAVAAPQPQPVGRINDALIGELQQLASVYEASGDKWRQYAYNKAVGIIKRIQHPITNVTDLAPYRGIGEKILGKIDEILKTGHTQKLQFLRQSESVQAAETFVKIWGVGPSTARTIYLRGITTIEQLRTSPARHELLNAAQLTGLRFLEDLQYRIPRAEVTQIQSVAAETLQTILSKETQIHVGMRDFLPADIHKQRVVDLVTCGSYRRGKATSGDVDVLICDRTGKLMDGLLTLLVDRLKQTGLIVGHLTHGMRHRDEGGEHCDTWFGIVQVPDCDENHRLPNGDRCSCAHRDPSKQPQSLAAEEGQIGGEGRSERSGMGLEGGGNTDDVERPFTTGKHLARRLDLKVYSAAHFPFAVLYFTGSDYFNRSMRLYCQKKGFSLSDKDLRPVIRVAKEKVHEGTKIPCATERDIFNAAGLPYKAPEDRDL